MQRSLLLAFWLAAVITASALQSTIPVTHSQVCIFPEVWVDDDYPAGEDADGDEYFRTIQAAVEAVAEGGTVHVASGVYEEEVRVEKPLTLIGEDRGSTVIAPRGGGIGLEIEEVEGVVVSNFTLRDSRYGVVVGSAARVRIQNCTVLNSSTIAISVEWGYHLEILDCEVSGGGGVEIASSYSILVRDCVVHNSSRGIFIGGCHGVVAEGVVAANNTREGIYLGEVSNASISGVLSALNRRGIVVRGSSGVAVYNSSFKSNEDEGILVEGSSQVRVDNCTALNNLDGVTVDSSNRVILYGLTATGNEECGVLVLSSSRVVVARCKASLNSVGVGVGWSTGTTVIGSTIVQNYECGVVCEYSKATVKYNLVSDNTWGLLAEGLLAEVDARYNWWGDPSGPGGDGPGSGDPVTGPNVWYEPWLESPDIPVFPNSLMDLYALFARLGFLNATIVYGSSLDHGSLYGARVVDVVGGTRIAEALRGLAWNSGLAAVLDTEVYEEPTEQFTGPGLKPIIAVGGPGVNYGWWHYNRIFTSTTSNLHAWFIIRQGSVRVRTSSGRTYRANRTHTYAVVQVYWDQDYGRPALLIAGITGVATRAACDWLASRIDGWEIFLEPAAALVLAVEKENPENVAVVERVIVVP